MEEEGLYNGERNEGGRDRILFCYSIFKEWRITIGADAA